MANLLNHLAERVAVRSSRRGFLATLGKVVGGLAVALTGASINDTKAFASGILACCTGRYCGGDSCPRGTFKYYTWTCYFEPAGGEPVTCQDCYSEKGYYCTYA